MPSHFPPLLTTTGIHMSFDGDGRSHLLLLPLLEDGESLDMNAAAELLKGRLF
jgi:hypothetical protein